MALQISGTMSLDDIQDEFGGANPININEYYKGGTYVPNTTTNSSIPTSGEISFDDFYGGDDSTSTPFTSSSGPGDGSNCLAYGTLIEMSGGTFKPIEDVAVGDEVVSYNIETLSYEEDAWIDWYARYRIFGEKTVSTVISNTLGRNGTYYLINNNLKITNEHPMLMKKGDTITWERMDSLKVGNSIFNSDLEWVEVTSIERVDVEFQTGNLDVEQVDNYFAGGILVHNAEQELVDKDDGPDGPGDEIAY